uniref:Mucin-5AC-like n=2 Tax=Hirondellea gigas TaxID=1518452 RepID=A0A6A7G2K9_9CRUS
MVCIRYRLPREGCNTSPCILEQDIVSLLKIYQYRMCSPVSNNHVVSKNMNIINSTTTSSICTTNSAIMTSSAVVTNMATTAASKTINITNVTPIISSTAGNNSSNNNSSTTTKLTIYNASNISLSTSNSVECNTTAPLRTPNSSSGSSTVVTIPTVTGTIALGAASPQHLVSSTDGASVSSSSVAVAVPTVTVMSAAAAAPPLHIPRGAAAVANINSSRTSQAVTATSAGQRSSVLPHRGIQLAPSNWSRTPSTILTCGPTSSSTAPIITTIPTSTTSIATTKFTRLPLVQQPIRQTSTSVITTNSANIIRSTVTRVTSSNIIAPNSSTTRAIAGNAGALARTTITGSSITVPRVTNSANISRALINTRSPGSVRPPIVTALSQPLRLNQAIIGPQRPASLASYAFTPVQRPTVSVQGNVRPRTPSGSGARFPLSIANAAPSNVTNSGGGGSSSSIITPTNFSSTRNVAITSNTSNVVPAPARPQSNPSLSSNTVRPLLCTSRPSSTGPPMQTVRTPTAGAAGVVRTGAGAGFIKNDAGDATTAVQDARGAPPHARLQQYVINTPTMQKVQSVSNMSNSINAVRTAVTGVTAAFNSSVAVSGASQILRLTSPAAQLLQPPQYSSALAVATCAASQASGVPNNNNSSGVNLRAGARPADLQIPIIGGGGGGSNSAAAAAATLPPGTTITPAVMTPPPPQHLDAQILNQPNLYMQKTNTGNASVGSQYSINSPSSLQGFIDNKPITCQVSNNSTMIRSNSAGTGGSNRKAFSSSGNNTLISDSSVAPPPQQQQQQQPTVSAAAKLAASPRPSILRKRSDYDTVTVNPKACKNLSSALSFSCGSSSGSSSSPPSPKRPDSREASTGSVTLSANSSPGLLIEECDSNEEPRPALPVIPVAAPVVTTSLPDGISPRKKPRKQQLTGNELLDAHHSSEEEDKNSRQAKAKRFKRDLECDEDMEICSGGVGGWSPDRSNSSVHPRLTLPSPSNHKNHRTTSHGAPPSVFNRHNSSAVSGGNAASAHNSNRTPATPNKNNTNNSNVSRCISSSRVPLNIRNCANDTTTTNNNSSVNTNKRIVNKMSVPLSNISPNTINSNNNSNSNNSSKSSGSSGSPDGKFIVGEKKHMSLIDTYRPNWQVRRNHFNRHCEVKVKEDKRINMNSLTAQRTGSQRLQGWKIVHIGGQVSDLVTVENEVSTRFNELLQSFEGPNEFKQNQAVTKDLDQVCELIKANVQRSKIIHDQMKEANAQMQKLFVHKDRVAKILTKYGSKRQLRKKERR